MMNPLKYGTLVLAGLATIGGIYYESTARFQVYAKDYIEIIEGVREREYIATAISGTNSVNILIATNRVAIQQLDAVISNLAPYFVNQTRINDWLATTNRAPYRWTYTDLRDNVGKELGAYPLQTNQKELVIRFAYLKLLIYTDDTCDWTDTMRGYLREPSSGTTMTSTDTPSTNFTLNYYVGTNVTDMGSAKAWWTANGVPLEATLAWAWSDAYTYTNDVTITLNSLSSSSTDCPLYFWNYYTDFTVIVTKKAERLNPPENWFVDFGYFGRCYYWWSSEFRKSKMVGGARNLDLTRTDYFYAYGAQVQETNVTSNVISVVSSVYVEPPDYSSSLFKHAEYTDTAIADTDDPVLTLSSPNVYIRYTSTNNNYSSTVSGGSSNVIPRNVIHKWDVTRCRP